MFMCRSRRSSSRRTRLRGQERVGEVKSEREGKGGGRGGGGGEGGGGGRRGEEGKEVVERRDEEKEDEGESVLDDTTSRVASILQRIEREEGGGEG